MLLGIVRCFAYVYSRLDAFHATLASPFQKYGPNEIPVIETPIWKMILSQFVGLLDASDGESCCLITRAHVAITTDLLVVHPHVFVAAKASSH